MPPAVTITLVVLGALALLIWAGLTWIYVHSVRQLGAATPEPADDVPEAVLEKVAWVEQWATDNGYEWIGFLRLAATHNGLWRKDRILLVAVAGDVGEPTVGFNSAFSHDRELLTTRQRLEAAHALLPGAVRQHWLGASWEQLEQLHEEGMDYLQGEAGWGQAVQIPDLDGLLTELRRTHERWVAFIKRPRLWPLRFTATLARLIALPKKRTARQCLPLDKARRM